jgi:PKHD-type hydroxylase
MDYFYFEGGFSPFELEKISTMVENLPYYSATTAAGETGDRKSRLKWIPQNEEWGWLYEKLMKYAKDANDRMWNFDLISAPENIQYTEYHASDGGEYGWHQDIGPDELSARKISITVQLSDDSEYEGGDLLFWMGGNSLEENTLLASKGKGTVVIFPSYMVHAVKPVTKGIRKSFVLWLGGGHYK